MDGTHDSGISGSVSGAYLAQADPAACTDGHPLSYCNDAASLDGDIRADGDADPDLSDLDGGAAECDPFAADTQADVDSDFERNADGGRKSCPGKRP